MNYIDIYETKKKADFEAILELFESAKISYTTLYDYRLYPEKVHDYLSMADEGAIIRVRQNDLIKANHLLISKGFKNQVDKAENEFPFIVKQRKFLDRIPLLENLSSGVQLISVTFIAISLVLIFLTIGISRSIRMPLEGQNWCVQSISKDDKNLHPNTDELIVFIGAGCKEYIHFHKDGSVTLPGFRTKRVQGFWEFLDESNKKIRIFNLNDFEEIYEGTYEVDFKKLKGEIVLNSRNSIIVLKD